MFWNKILMPIRLDLAVASFFLKSGTTPMLGNSSRMKLTGTGSTRSSVRSARRTNLMIRNEVKRVANISNVESWSDVIQKYAHFSFPGSERSISVWLVICCTSLFCKICNLVPRPSTAFPFTFSAFAKSWYGPFAGWFVGSLSKIESSISTLLLSKSL